MPNSIRRTEFESTRAASTFAPPIFFEATGGRVVREWQTLSRGARSLGASRDATWVNDSLVCVIRDLLTQIVLQRDSVPLGWIGECELPALLDEASSAIAGAVDHEGDRFAVAIKSAFDNEPLEDGHDHPAEHVLEVEITKYGESALRRIRALVLDTERPALGASVLRCLGRLEAPGTPDWRVELLRDALAEPEVELRDAAIQAAELWGGDQVVDVLRAHDESEPWLRDYLCRVIRDLAK